MNLLMFSNDYEDYYEAHLEDVDVPDIENESYATPSVIFENQTEPETTLDEASLTTGVFNETILTTRSHFNDSEMAYDYENLASEILNNMEKRNLGEYGTTNSVIKEVVNPEGATVWGNETGGLLESFAPGNISHLSVSNYHMETKFSTQNSTAKIEKFDETWFEKLNRQSFRGKYI